MRPFSFTYRQQRLTGMTHCISAASHFIPWRRWTQEFLTDTIIQIYATFTGTSSSPAEGIWVEWDLLGILFLSFFFVTVEFVSTSHGFWCSSRCLCRLSYHFCWKRTDCFCGAWSRASIRGRMQFIWASLLDAVKTSIFGLITHLEHQNLVFLKIFWTSFCGTWVVAALFFPLSAGAIWALCVTQVSHQHVDQMGNS